MKGNIDQQDAVSHVSGQSNDPMTRPAHALTVNAVAEELKTSLANGLSTDDASGRLTQYGLNDLGEEKGVSAVSIFAQQIFNSMTLVCSSLPR